MKRGFLLVVLFFVLPLASAICPVTEQACGCWGLQIRYTLSDGTCSPWSQCSVSTVETQCTDNNDNDCDGLVDCADSDCGGVASCIDEDGDGFSVVIDCKDNNPAINPAAEEVCNSRDDNCDGRIDEDLVRTCGQSGVGLCSIGEERCLQGIFQGCNAVLPAAEAR